jgi:ATP/maltotriose-dependent transcriptional regulator MalT
VSTSTVSFVGRSAERQPLCRALDPLRHGGRLAVIEGPAGVGKTRLVELVADGLGDTCSVVWARADALDQDQPFSAVQELVRLVGDPSLRDALLTGAAGFVARLA